MTDPMQSASKQDPWGAAAQPTQGNEIPNVFFALLGNNRHRIALADLEKLGIGGTALVYLVKRGPCNGYVVKLYNGRILERRRGEFENKAKKMLLSPPLDADMKTRGQTFPQFAWPEAVIQDEHGNFCGILLPFINRDEAYELSTYIGDVNTLDKKHQSITERIQVARNLAGALSNLHRAGHYFVDMKPQNIMVFRNSSLVSFIDCDGFSINRGEFPARHFSPGYIAPEELDHRPEQLSESPTQDCYVLAMLIFQLLDFGNNPYACRVENKALLSDDEELIQDDRARKGLYAYGLNPAKGLLPRAVSIYQYWPNEIRCLFDRAFTAKRGVDRPTTLEWYSTLSKLIDDWAFEKCAKHPNDEKHRHFKGTGCFACEVFSKKAVDQPPRPFKDVHKKNKTKIGGESPIIEPTPPLHWTDLLPPKYDRLRSIFGKLRDGHKLPFAFNPLAGVLQFLWLFAHGLIAKGLTFGLMSLAFGLMVIWNPNLNLIGVLYLIAVAIVLSIISDYLLYRRIDALVTDAGGYLCIDSQKLEAWIKPQHQGWILGPVIIVVLLGAKFWRTTQIENIQDHIAMAIQSMETLKVDIESVAKEDHAMGRVASLSAYYEAKRDYKPVSNADADIKPEGGNFVLTLKELPLVKGKRVLRRPVMNDGRVDWFCWSDEIEEYMMPTNCRSRPTF